MTSDDAQPAPRPHRKLDDPKAMRAVAHPTRIALLEALAVQEPLTATEAASIVGESPTNCAFHLRTLAKYGFVEEAAGGAGRRRPWRRSHIGFSVGDYDTDSDGSAAPEDPETRMAAQALAGVLQERWIERIRLVGARRAGFPDAWRKVTGSSESVLFMTAEEAEQFKKDLLELTRRHHERLDDPTRRPAGSFPIEIISFTHPFDAVTRQGD